MFGSKMEQEKKFDLSQKYSKRTKKKGVARKGTNSNARALGRLLSSVFSVSVSLFER